MYNLPLSGPTILLEGIKESKDVILLLLPVAYKNHSLHPFVSHKHTITSIYSANY